MIAQPEKKIGVSAACALRCTAQLRAMTRAPGKRGWPASSLSLAARAAPATGDDGGESTRRYSLPICRVADWW
jgi:hypothetical protein